MTAIAVLYIGGVFAQVLAPYGYTDQDLTETRNPPSFEHPFGTDDLGRDILSLEAHHVTAPQLAIDR